MEMLFGMKKYERKEAKNLRDLIKKVLCPRSVLSTSVPTKQAEERHPKYIKIPKLTEKEIKLFINTEHVVFCK